MSALIVKASRRDDGRGSCPYRDFFEIPVKAGAQTYSTRGQLFDGLVGDRLVVSRSTQPLLDACRRGVDPSTRVVLRHEGHEYDALPSTVGKAAKLRGTGGKGDRSSGTPYDEQTRQGSPSMRQDEEAGV